MDHFSHVKAINGLRQSLVITVANAARQRFDPIFARPVSASRKAASQPFSGGLASNSRTLESVDHVDAVKSIGLRDAAKHRLRRFGDELLPACQGGIYQG